MLYVVLFVCICITTPQNIAHLFQHCLSFSLTDTAGVTVDASMLTLLAQLGVCVRVCVRVRAIDMIMCTYTLF